MDHIAIVGIRAMGCHGADQGEREVAQPFEIDIFLDVDLHEAAASDELAATVNYATLHARVVKIVRERSFVLLERLADELLTSIFADARIASARLRVAKPGKLQDATPSVELVRANPRFRP